MRTPPDYYEQVRQNAAQLWEKLEQDPELAGPWHQLFKQVQSPRHILSELLQNADDARATEATVRIENQTFIFEHNGDDFTEEQFASLCRFGYSNKRALHTIGFRGVGFKSTFCLGDPVKLVTPTLSICFFQKRFTEPQWVDGETDTLGKTRVMVQMADPNRQGQVEKNLEEWLENPFSLLFFKNLRRICIADTELQWGSLGPGPVANSEWMALNEDTTHDYLLIRSDAESFPDDAIEEIRSERMLERDEEEEFPSCEIDILVGLKGKLYVVLPTGVDTQLPFACNAPFIQDPARLKIKDPETSPTNRWLLERAGKLAASTMLGWLRNTDLSAAERAQAYSLFPDVDRADESLNGVCGKSVECSFKAQVESERLLLTEAGSLVAQKRSVAVPLELFDIWPGEQIDKFLGYRKRPALSQYIAPDDRRKLLNWGLIEEIGKQDFIRILETKSAPRPRSWQELLKLWAYVAPEVAGIGLYSSRFSAANLRIAPVQGKQVLFAPKKVVRLGKRKLLNSDSDWKFLHRHLIVLNPNWPRFLAKQRRNAADHDQPLLSDEVDMAYEVLEKAGLDKTSDVSKVVREVGRQFFSHERVDLQDCVRLSQIAAKLGAKVSGAFKFMTAKSNLRSAGYGLLFDADGGLWSLLPKKLRDSSVLHPAYVEEFMSCSNEEWNRWISSGDAGLQTFVCPVQSSKSYRSRRGLERALRSRGCPASVEHKYRAPKFCIRDWDFPAALWNHWQQMSLEDDDVWRKIAVRILSEKDAFWGNKESPEVIERGLYTELDGRKKQAERFFMEGIGNALANMHASGKDDSPVTIYYAFKQSEVAKEGLTSPGWATFLQAVIKAGYVIGGTWPVRTELVNKIIAINANVLASSIVLVCRKRQPDAPVITRREFVARLRSTLPAALAKIRSGGVGPVDMAQASIGPGMGVFTAAATVLEPDDTPMTVRTAIALINQIRDEISGEEATGYDADTRFCIDWFENFGMDEGKSGDAITMAQAYDIGIEDLEIAGVFDARGGSARLLRRDELPGDWNPATDRRLTDWECAQHLARTLESPAGGIEAAAKLYANMPPERSEAARMLAYCLYDICERRDRAAEAQIWNMLAREWTALEAAAASVDTQPGLGQLL